jgi:hypothetical protein
MQTTGGTPVVNSVYPITSQWRLSESGHMAKLRIISKNWNLHSHLNPPNATGTRERMDLQNYSTAVLEVITLAEIT